MNGLQLVWSGFLAYSIIQGILLLIVFPTFRQGSKQAKWLLAMMALLTSLILTEDLVDTVIGYENAPHLLFAFSPFWYAFGPLLFFYIRLYVHGKKVKWVDIWHFIPMLIVFASLLKFYGVPSEFKIQYLHNMEMGITHPTHNLNFILFSTQCISYLIINGIMLSRKKTENSAKSEFKWLRYLIGTLAIISLQSLISLYVLNKHQFSEWTNSLYYISLIVFLLMLFLRSIKNPKTLYLIGRLPSFKSFRANSSIDYQRICAYMKENKPFSDPAYDIQDLATTLGYSKHSIKQLIKEHTQLSFRDYVNMYRVEEAKKRLKSPDSKQYTIESIAEKSGFNSQATFYRVFKKYEGSTPKSFISS